MIRCSGISSIGVSSFAAALGKLKNLQEITLTSAMSPNIDDVGLTSLSEGFKGLSCLRTLDINFEA